MSFRAIFTSFDHFMAMFVALFGVFSSTAFMPLLGGPLHAYETRAIGAGWQSLRSGEAASLTDAFEIATSFPAEAVFPSAQAQELPLRLAHDPVEVDALELLGGPDIDRPPVMSARRIAPRVGAARVTPVSAEPTIEIETTELVPICSIPTMKRGLCEGTPAVDRLEAST